MIERILIPTLLWDMDNTLIECGLYYTQAQDRVIDLIADRTRLPAAVVKAVLGAIDVAASTLPNGFARSRMPNSFAAAAAACELIQGRSAPDRDFGSECWRIGDAVFSAPYTLYPGAWETLEAYKQGGWQMLLYSKGDPTVQWDKINKRGFTRIFGTDGCHIVMHKTVEALRDVLTLHDVDIANSWIIGDSLRDEVGPGLELGLKAIHITNGRGVWGHENQHHVPTAGVPDVAQVLNIIPQFVAGRELPAAA